MVYSIAALESLELTRREAEVLLWVAKDKSNVEIAKVLNCYEGTVRKHLEHLYKKLEVQTCMGSVITTLERLGLLQVWFVARSSQSYTRMIVLFPKFISRSIKLNTPSSFSKAA